MQIAKSLIIEIEIFLEAGMHFVNHWPNNLSYGINANSEKTKHEVAHYPQKPL